MRPMTTAIVAAFTLLAPCAAQALGVEDTMAAWGLASTAEREALVDDLATALPAGHVDRAAILACMDRAASAGGHGGLRIGDMAEACSAPAPPASDGRIGI